MCINKRICDILPDNDVPGDGMGDDMPSSACSPEFDTLDARLQDKFMDFLSEKGVDAIIVEGLFDSGVYSVAV